MEVQANGSDGKDRLRRCYSYLCGRRLTSLTSQAIRAGTQGAVSQYVPFASHNNLKYDDNYKSFWKRPIFLFWVKPYRFICKCVLQLHQWKILNTFWNHQNVILFPIYSLKVCGLGFSRIVPGSLLHPQTKMTSRWQDRPSVTFPLITAVSNCLVWIIQIVISILLREEKPLTAQLSSVFCSCSVLLFFALLFRWCLRIMTTLLLKSGAAWI